MGMTSLEIEKKARSKSIEVEDILDCAQSQDQNIVSSLRKIADENQWLGNSEVGGGVPYLSWIETVVVFLTYGIEGLNKLRKNDDSFSGYILTLLASFHSNEAMKALRELFSDELSDPKLDEDVSSKMITAINQTMSFAPKVILDVSTENSFRNFLHEILDETQDDITRANVYCALRGVGNDDSIYKITTFPPLGGAWEGLEKIVIKAIKSGR